MKMKFICIFTALSVVVICCFISKKEKEIEITHLMLSNIEALSSSLESPSSTIKCWEVGSVKCEKNGKYVESVTYHNLLFESEKY